MKATMIKDLKRGKVAIQTTDLEKTKKILKEAFPFDKEKITSPGYYRKYKFKSIPYFTKRKSEDIPIKNI